MRKNLVRLSEFEYAQLEKARDELMKKGIANLPNVQSLCPRCGNQLDGFKISYEHLKCSHCDYEENTAGLTAVGGFALGLIVALGAAALIQILSQSGESPKR
jgi:hypothetical protein